MLTGAQLASSFYRQLRASRHVSSDEEAEYVFRQMDLMIHSLYKRETAKGSKYPQPAMVVVAQNADVLDRVQDEEVFPVFNDNSFPVWQSIDSVSDQRPVADEFFSSVFDRDENGNQIMDDDDDELDLPPLDEDVRVPILPSFQADFSVFVPNALQEYFDDGAPARISNTTAPGFQFHMAENSASKISFGDGRFYDDHIIVIESSSKVELIIEDGGGIVNTGCKFTATVSEFNNVVPPIKVVAKDKTKISVTFIGIKDREFTLMFRDTGKVPYNYFRGKLKRVANVFDFRSSG
jgi:hypothetical protein